MAVGVTPDYVVAVWVGNASGEGRPGLTGTEAAAPLMFDIFSQLEGKLMVSNATNGNGTDHRLRSQWTTQY
jgi:membrane carboxypeptidase/penicillin-binding protein PbpC